ncbi:MAG: DUF2721 domain-containing protein [Thermoplasmata archaeon]
MVPIPIDVQLVLAPIILVSAAGLLGLLLQNRYGRIIDRIRFFEVERRALTGGELNEKQKRRMEIIEQQLKILLKRGRYIKNSLFYILLSALLVVLFSFTALISSAIGNDVGQYVSFALFGISLLAVFAGVLYAILEIQISYKAVLIDIDALQENKK